MLITVGIKLTHPREFIQVFKVGKEQLAIFLITIVFTLYEDLLIGISAGILLQMLINIIDWDLLKTLFRTPTEVSFTDKEYLVEISQSAVFSNYIGIKSKLEAIPPGFKVTIDLKNTKMIDHSVMENLHRFEDEYKASGGKIEIIGLEMHQPVSEHHLAARKK